ncbi:MAG: hypothetical protein LBU39_06460 [Desulfobulbaceae bacterium]|nr:hypothetical protein [Desulfobulbaceae bacterium]
MTNGVAGGRVTSGSSQTATGNAVTISGGTIFGDIIGGFTSGGTAENNTITIQGSSTLDLSGATLKGGVAATSSGNILNINRSEVAAAGMSDFQTINFNVPTGFSSGDTMLSLSGAANISGVDVNISGLASAADANLGDNLTLLNAAGGLTGASGDGDAVYSVTTNGVLRQWSLDVASNTLTTYFSRLNTAGDLALNNFSVTSQTGMPVTLEVGGTLDTGGSLAVDNSSGGGVTVDVGTLDVTGNVNLNLTGTSASDVSFNTIEMGGGKTLSVSGSGAFDFDTMNVRGKDAAYNGVLNAAGTSLNFDIPTNFTNGDTMLAVSGAADISGAAVNINFTPQSSANLGDSLTLISASSLKESGLSLTAITTTANGVTSKWEQDHNAADNKLNFYFSTLSTAGNLGLNDFSMTSQTGMPVTLEVGGTLNAGSSLTVDNSAGGGTTVRVGTLSVVSNLNLALLGTSASDVKFNTIEMSGGKTLSVSGGGAFDFDTMNVRGANAAYRGNLNASGGNLNFDVPATAGDGTRMLSVNGSANISGSRVGFDLIGEHTRAMDRGDSIILVDSRSLSGSPANNNSIISVLSAGRRGIIDLDYDFLIHTDGNQLLATVQDADPSDESKAIGEGFLASPTLLNSIQDAVATKGVDQAVQAAGAGAGGIAGVMQSGAGARPFGAASLSDLTYNTGSSIEVQSAALIAGVSKAKEAKAGRLTMGGFFDGGHGGYDSYNSFPNLAAVHGEGDIDSIGGGLLARMDFAQFGQGISAGRFYADTSARLGQVKSDFASGDLRDATGTAAAFDTESLYYGLHLGGGYLLGVSESSQADFYARYLWTHQNGDDITLSTSDEINFVDIDSHRTVIGARYTWVAKSWLVPYVGAAWEHEFDGEAKAKVYGYDIDAPSLDGDTGMAEVGINMGSNSGSLAFDLGAQGYAGAREGVSGTLRMVYRW